MLQPPVAQDLSDHQALGRLLRTDLARGHHGLHMSIELRRELFVVVQDHLIVRPLEAGRDDSVLAWPLGIGGSAEVRLTRGLGVGEPGLLERMLLIGQSQTQRTGERRPEILQNLHKEPGGGPRDALGSLRPQPLEHRVLNWMPGHYGFETVELGQDLIRHAGRPLLAARQRRLGTQLANPGGHIGSQQVDDPPCDGETVHRCDDSDFVQQVGDESVMPSVHPTVRALLHVRVHLIASAGQDALQGADESRTHKGA